MNQQDYIRYQQAFKGNRVKGAELFRSLLEDSEIASDLVRTQAAAGAVFTDCSKAINKMLPSVLNETDHVPEMVLTYVNAGMGELFDTLEDAAESSQFTKVFHGRDIGELPFTLGGEYGKLLRIPDIAAGYSSGDEKTAIASNSTFINALGMTTRTITTSDSYAWQWTGTRIPGHGWYLFGAYATSYSSTRTARIWRVSGNGAVTTYTGPAQQEYIAACYHPKLDRVYAFRTTNTTASQAGSSKARQPEASLYLDVFKVNASGTLTKESTTTIGSNVNVFEMMYDPRREMFVCVGNGMPSFSFAGQSFTHPRTYAVPVIMIGDSRGWTVKLQYNFSRSPNSYMVRRMSYDRSTGKFLFLMAFNTSFILNQDNTIKEVIVNTDTSVNHTFGSVCVPVGKNRWIVNYITANSSSSLKPYLLELNDNNTLKAFTMLTSYKLDTVCYDPYTRYLGMLSGNYCAFDSKACSLRTYSSTIITGLSSRFIVTAPDTAETLAIDVGSEVNDYQTPSTTTKIKIVKPSYWEEET